MRRRTFCVSVTYSSCRTWTLAWRVVDNDADLLVAAMALQQKGSLSFWDALVVEAASAGGCARLYTEDLNPGQRFGSVEIFNPFGKA
jgi:predicted nucleic acid-binding protein